MADAPPLDQESHRIRASVAAALEDVDSIGLNGADRAVSLGVILAVRLQALGNAGLEVPGHAATTPSKAEEQTRPVVHGQGLVGRICAALKIERDLADLVYDEKDGELGYVLSARRLATDKANATRQLAQIAAAGRQAAGLEAWTSAAILRELVNDYGKLDTNNFASYLGSLDKSNAVIFRGRGASREMKVTRAGMESISEMLTTLVSS